MEIGIIIAIVIFFLIYLLFKNSSEKIAPQEKFKDDYEIWLKIIKEEKTHFSEFDLFGTKAAICWNDNDEEVKVICITAFRNQKPITKKWDHFDFNIQEKYWVSVTPRGSPAMIREQLKILGLI